MSEERTHLLSPDATARQLTCQSARGDMAQVAVDVLTGEDDIRYKIFECFEMTDNVASVSRSFLNAWM